MQEDEKKRTIEVSETGERSFSIPLPVSLPPLVRTHIEQRIDDHSVSDVSLSSPVLRESLPVLKI